MSNPVIEVPLEARAAVTVADGPLPPVPDVAPAAGESIRWFKELTVRDTDTAGGKGANLGELTRFGMPVPPGFVVTAAAFREFLEEAGLRQPILDRLARLNVDDGHALKQTAEELQQQVRNAPVPEGLRQQVAGSYRELARRCAVEEPFVAVRSSATVEDMPGTSFAGMNESFLNVRGEEALLAALRNCWASLHGARVIFYRRKQNIPEERIAIAVIVQQMVDAEAAGVMFTVNPANNDRRTVVIEGAFGLGDTVVSGKVSPDHWEVNKDTLEITRERISPKHVLTYRDEQGHNQQRTLSPEESCRPSLTEEQVKQLADLGRRIEEHYGSPQDVEYAIAGGQIFIVQSRPVTALGQEPARPGESPDGHEVLVRGLGASPGLRAGTARVLKSLGESDRLQPGDILVARMTEPDWTPLMKKAAAIVTDEGGMTAHAAIVSRELGIPCIVGTQDATRRIADGTLVTVDARQGAVYRGRREETQREAGAVADAAPAVAPVTARPARPVTATRLYVNLGQPELAEKVAREDVDGVGLLRIEFMVLAVTGNTHPRKLLQDGRGNEFRDRLAENLALFARAFAPRPVVARTTDFRTNEYRNMAGGEAFEPEEANPMIGYRGVYRYIREPDLFRLELEAFRKVREEQGLKNLVLMLPFVRTLSELRACRHLMDEVGLTRDLGFPFWVMAEVPSIIYRLPDYAMEGVTGVSIGSNDLTQLMLGVDRDSQTLSSLFDERDPAVLGAIRDIITSCRQLDITCSICGQAPSVYPELTEKLVAWGIDSISVNPDVIDPTRRIIGAAEQRVLLNGVRRSRGQELGERIAETR
jgi:pyruvate,water dikinase